MVRLQLALVALLTLSLALIAWPAGGEGVYTVTANYPVQVKVNGVERPVPAYARPGDNVCAPESVYLDEGSRVVFRGWDGFVRDPCVRVAGNLSAVYVKEHLVHIYTQPEALRRSVWVESGTFLTLDYPAVYNESEGVRWVFQSWSAGETPFQPSNRVYVSKPLRVEAHYVKEFRLTALGTHGVKVNGSGWYREGALAVVSGPKEAYIGNLTRLALTEWVSAGSVPAIVVPQSSMAVAVLEVRGPHVVVARYRAEHLVVVTSPQGVLYSDWVGEGDEVRLSVPEHIQLGQDTRLRFAGWRGLENHPVPELRFRVSEPVNAEAVYVRQYLLTVSSPVGAGGAGWYDEGARAVVVVPENPPANVFVKRRLTGFSGDCGECVHRKGVMELVMDRPRTITAAYASEPDIVNLGILAGVVVAGGVAYAAGKRGGEKGGKGAKHEVSGPVPTCDVCGSELPAGAFFCPYCGAERRKAHTIMSEA